MTHDNLTDPDPEPGHDERTEIYMLRKIYKRLADLEKQFIEFKEDRDQYRDERHRKEETTLDIIKKEINNAAQLKELKVWELIKDRALYVAGALLVAWLIQYFVK